MKNALDKNTSEAILAERNAAYEFKKQGDYAQAELHYLKAWALFPEPKYEWGWSQDTIYSISNFYLELKNFEKALHWAELVFKTNPLPGDGAPYVMLGKIYFESDKIDLAFENFKKAFLLAGKRAFEGEDKKYLDFYKERAARK